MADRKEPILLSAAQIQNFICDGSLVLQTDVDQAVHTRIEEQFSWLAENEPNPGNNILPRLPELIHILDCAVIRGAIISLLGEHYVIHPHRFWHCLSPDGESYTDEKMKEAIRSASHQDDYTPVSHARSHCLQYLRFMYYSHDVAFENGPTHVIPGSQYHAALTDEDLDRQTPLLGKAGTVFISHFDIGHCGGPNLSSRFRNMIKFVFTRGRQAEAPAARYAGMTWKRPSGISAPCVPGNCWRHQWDRLCGNAPEPGQEVCDPTLILGELENESDTNKRLELIQQIGETRSPEAVPVLSSLLNRGHQAERTTAIYALAELGQSAIGPMVTLLAEARERAAEDPLLDKSMAMDDACYVLSAIGERSVELILPLLASPYDWTVVNAIHALNDIGVNRADVRDALEALLRTGRCAIICHAANALGSIGAESSVPALCGLLDQSYNREIKNKLGWPEEWQIHFSAALALARIGQGMDEHEDAIIRHLDHPFGQVGICLTEALKRIGTQTALKALVEALGTRRWDAALSEEKGY